MRQENNHNLLLTGTPYVVFGVALLIMLSALGAYAYFFWFRLGHSVSEDPAAWGVFGDFIGGLANPIVSLATLLIVVLAYIHQRRELAATATALRESNYHQEVNRKIDAIGVQIGQLDAEIRSLTGQLETTHSTPVGSNAEAYRRRKSKIEDIEIEITSRLERRHSLVVKIGKLTGIDTSAIEPSLHA